MDEKTTGESSNDETAYEPLVRTPDGSWKPLDEVRDQIRDQLMQQGQYEALLEQLKQEVYVRMLI